MADIRSVTPPAAAPTRPLPPARAQSIVAAQKAFFDQALASEAFAAPVRAPPPAAASGDLAPAPPATRLAFDPAEPTPSRPLRPGSLLDIKV